MDKLFHSHCFCCMTCQRPLQGLQFYDRDGQPQCEECFVVSFAQIWLIASLLLFLFIKGVYKCTATGVAGVDAFGRNPREIRWLVPRCWMSVQGWLCGCFEGVAPRLPAPLTFDTHSFLAWLAVPRAHAAPRFPQDSLPVCARCGEHVTDRVLKAVGQSFHAQCFRCSTCDCSLEGAPFITDDDSRPYCVPDYHRWGSPPAASSSPLRSLWCDVLTVLPERFCSKSQEGPKTWAAWGPLRQMLAYTALYCFNVTPLLCLSLSRYSPVCVSCKEPIVPDPGSEETVRVVALDKNFHLKCYRCEVMTPSCHSHRC